MDLTQDSVSIIEDPAKEVVTNNKKPAQKPNKAASKPQQGKEASGEVKSAENAAQEKQENKPEEFKVKFVGGEKPEAQAEVNPPRKKTKAEIASLVVSIVLLVLMVPIFLINVVLIFSSIINPNDVPNIFGLKPMIVLSDSMYPQIKTNDLIIAKGVKDLSTLQVGDVISFREKKADGSLGAVVTHKIVYITVDSDGQYKITTTGINNIVRDNTGAPQKNADGEIVTYTDDPISGDQVIGIYVGRIPGFGGFMYWMQSIWGIIVCIGLPVLTYIIYELVKRNAQLKAERASSANASEELEELKRKLAEMEKKK